MVVGFLLSAWVLLFVVFRLVKHDDWSRGDDGTEMREGDGRGRSEGEAGAAEGGGQGGGQGGMEAQGVGQVRGMERKGGNERAGETNGEGGRAKEGYSQFDRDEKEEERDGEGEGLLNRVGRIVGTYWSILSAEGSASISFFSLIYVMGIATSLVEHLVFLFFVQVALNPRPRKTRKPSTTKPTHSNPHPRTLEP